jgi:hypothetical protein
MAFSVFVESAVFSEIKQWSIGGFLNKILERNFFNFHLLGT